jgi:uncharacterized protein (TIGR02466 family)
MQSVNRVIGLFPTPFMRVEKLLPADLVAALVLRFGEQAQVANANSPALSHTQMQSPGADEHLSAVSQLVLPRLADFGELLFGQRLDWAIKEMWVNLLQTGGQQALHNHANCFVSGVIYLTPMHPSAQTVFVKGLGGRDFVFANAHANTQQGPFNADKWIAPPPSAGDLVLFPSYLLHEVPPNQGPLRISLAFNGIPNRLDSWGYTVGLTA